MALADNISRRNKNNGARKSEAAVERLLDLDARKSQGMYHDASAGIYRQAPAWTSTTPLDESIRHLNISLSSRSDLGKALDPEFNLEWEHPDFGRFMSLKAFWHYVLGREADNRIRMLRSRELREFAANRRGTLDRNKIPNFQALILKAAYDRITSLPGLYKLVMDSNLPFENYIPGTRDSGARRADHASWFIPGMEIIRFALIKGEHPDFTDFLNSQETYDDIVRQLKSREVVDVPKVASIPNLSQFLSHGPAANDPKVLRAKGVKAAPAQTPKAKPTQTRAAKPAGPMSTLAAKDVMDWVDRGGYIAGQKPDPKAAKSANKKGPKPAPVKTKEDRMVEIKTYINTLDGAYPVAIVTFEERAHAIRFIFGAMDKLAKANSNELDVDLGGGTLYMGDAMEGVQANDGTTKVVIYDHNGQTNLMRLQDGSFDNPFNDSIQIGLELPEGEDLLDYVVNESRCPASFIHHWRRPQSRKEATLIDEEKFRRECLEIAQEAGAPEAVAAVLDVEPVSEPTAEPAAE